MQDEPSWTSSTASKDLCDSLNGLIHTPVLKDRLLTDSMLQTNGVVSTDEFPVSAEHSYSLGGSATSRTNSTFGSDGDSMPESPLSLDDGKCIYLYIFDYFSSQIFIKSLELFFHTLWRTVLNLGLLGRQMSVQAKHNQLFK